MVNQSFHFDPTVTNWAQGDQLNFTEEFYATQVRNNPSAQPPDTGSGRIWDPELKRCVDGDPVLWIIGDIEPLQTDDPKDEFNWPGAFGIFPAFSDPYPIPPNTFANFPWNSNFSSGYATDFDIDFNYAGVAPINVRLSLGWSPGRSGTEQKQALLDNVIVGTTPNVVGANVAGWYENMPRRVDTFDFVLSPGAHSLTLKQLKGNGTLWDFVKLEKI